MRRITISLDGEHESALKELRKEIGIEISDSQAIRYLLGIYTRGEISKERELSDYDNPPHITDPNHAKIKEKARERAMDRVIVTPAQLPPSIKRQTDEENIAELNGTLANEEQVRVEKERMIRKFKPDASNEEVEYLMGLEFDNEGNPIYE